MVEFLCCGITSKVSFLQSQDLLLDPNIWITDTGATVHTTAHKQGFHTLTTATDANSITMGNGIAEKASLVGKLNGTMCNKNGAELGTATLTDVVHLPTGSFKVDKNDASWMDPWRRYQGDMADQRRSSHEF
jgi:hypothetical protein